jgi:hypothetical protein
MADYDAMVYVEIKMTEDQKFVQCRCHTKTAGLGPGSFERLTPQGKIETSNPLRSIDLRARTILVLVLYFSPENIPVYCEVRRHLHAFCQHHLYHSY